MDNKSILDIIHETTTLFDEAFTFSYDEKLKNCPTGYLARLLSQELPIILATTKNHI